MSTRKPTGLGVLDRLAGIVCSLLGGIAIELRGIGLGLYGKVALDERPQTTSQILRHRSRLQRNGGQAEAKRGMR